LIPLHETTNQVVVFAKSWCKHCAATKELLGGDEFKDIDIAIHDLDKMEDGPAMQKAMENKVGTKSVPCIYIDGTYLGGNDKLQEAYKEGTILKTMGVGVSAAAADPASP
jgi:glutaredoxin 3